MSAIGNGPLGEVSLYFLVFNEVKTNGLVQLFSGDVVHIDLGLGSYITTPIRCRGVKYYTTGQKTLHQRRKFFIYGKTSAENLNSKPIYCPMSG